MHRTDLLLLACVAIAAAVASAPALQGPGTRAAELRPAVAAEPFAVTGLQAGP